MSAIGLFPLDLYKIHTGGEIVFLAYKSYHNVKTLSAYSVLSLEQRKSLPTRDKLMAFASLLGLGAAVGSGVYFVLNKGDDEAKAAIGLAVSVQVLSEVYYVESSVQEKAPTKKDWGPLVTGCRKAAEVCFCLKALGFSGIISLGRDAQYKLSLLAGAASSMASSALSGPAKS